MILSSNEVTIKQFWGWIVVVIVILVVNGFVVVDGDDVGVVALVDLVNEWWIWKSQIWLQITYFE